MSQALYQSIAEARADGWLLMDCAFPTKHFYYYRNGETLRKDELVIERKENDHSIRTPAQVRPP